MPIDTQLFAAGRVRLTAPEPDRDAEVLARWSEDDDFSRRMSNRPARPQSVAAARKDIDDLARESQKDRLYYFHLRLLDSERLIGVARIQDIAWPQGTGEIRLGIGAAADRNQGYGREAMQLLLRLAFDELGLHRLDANVAGWNAEAMRFVARFGFVEEVRRRQALSALGQRHDDVWLGLLRREWVR